jgi:enoyl-CoA hydratase/carnithine racemase|tara:strand:+ start:3379 stop:4164 length:786 start_codon:yes stop_codon:yes gene_type:complete
MDLTTVEYAKEGAVAYVTLNRPDKLNAMNETMHRELGEVWADFRDDASLRVAILAGNGRCFSAGADLSGSPPASGTGGAPRRTYTYPAQFTDITQTQRVFKPIIAAMHNHVIGYGMWIALDADIRIAAEDVTFWLPEPQWGIATIPAGWFPKIMPWAIASELLLMADRVTAERAYQVGMVNKVVPRDQLMAQARKVADRICELSPMAVQGMKESMVRASSLDYSAIDQITDWVQTRVMNSEDRAAGGEAFAERRKVDWPGR